MCRLILRFVLIPPSVACCRAEQPSPADPTKHVVNIRREAADDKQSAMIAAAEAAQPSKEVPILAV